MSSPLRTFDGWGSVPPDLKSRNSWLRAGRRVKKQEMPVARVVYPQIVDESWCLDDRMVILDETDDLTVVSTTPTPLFHRDQTKPYQPSARTQAYWAYEDMFLRYARKDSWIRMHESGTWLTEFEDPYARNSYESNRLSSGMIRSHINQRNIIGVKGDQQTRFIMIDLDFHGRNHEVFLDQAEILLNRFHGTEAWHYQVKTEDVSGVHFINVLAAPESIETVTSELRKILIELDAQNPELSDRARAAGMKTLADLEIYPTPNNGNGVRLPLCRDRIMFLDEPMPLITVKKRQVQDVGRYVNWINDSNRQYMPKEHIWDHLRYFAIPNYTPGKPKSPRVVKKTERSPVPARWKGNLRRSLYEFWIEGKSNGRPLNEHLAIVCRLAAVQGYGEKKIVEGVMKMVKDLPASAKSCSSRLLSGKIRQIHSSIRSTAKYAYQDNGHQHDPTMSTEILAAALMCWSEFDSLDTATWTVPTAKKTVVPNWTDQQRQRLCAFFRKPLFIKDHDLIMRFIDAIVNLTMAKEKEGSGWGKEYLHKWMKSQFPEIKCAKDEKRHRILRCLEDEGIIVPKARGKAGMYATHWTLGKVAKQALGITDAVTAVSTSDISSNVLDVTNNTSTYYGSLFSEHDFYEYDIDTVVHIDHQLSTIGFGEEKPSSVDLANKTENSEPQSPEQLTTVV